MRRGPLQCQNQEGSALGLQSSTVEALALSLGAPVTSAADTTPGLPGMNLGCQLSCSSMGGGKWAQLFHRQSSN